MIVTWCVSINISWYKKETKSRPKISAIKTRGPECLHMKPAEKQYEWTGCESSTWMVLKSRFWLNFRASSVGQYGQSPHVWVCIENTYMHAWAHTHIHTHVHKKHACTHTHRTHTRAHMHTHSVELLDSCSACQVLFAFSLPWKSPRYNNPP